MLVTNDDFARQFFAKQTVSRPFLTQLPARKPAGTIRIFLLGESAAMGTPDPAFGPARMLEMMLRQQYPQKDIQVINAAMRGIDSHVVRRVARDCAALEPDLFIVYTGNNEGIGLHAPGPDTSLASMDWRLIRFSEWCKATRLGQLIWHTLAARTPLPAQDMAFFRRYWRAADDPRMDRLRENFRRNLEAICDAGRCPKLLATVPVNLADCPPLGSVHRADLTPSELALWNEAYERGIAAESAQRHAEAITHYQTAAALDRHYADLQYRLARCFLRVNNGEQARRHFIAARDADALPFRTDSRLNAAVRRVAEARQAAGVSLSDVEAAFAASDLSEQGIPGGRLFHEHVHTTFAGTHLLARTLYAGVTNVLAAALGAPAAVSLPTPAECARQLAYTPLDEYNVLAAMARLTANPPFLDQIDHYQRQAALERRVEQLKAALTPETVQNVLATYHTAVRARPNDWALRHNLGNVCLQLNRRQEGLEQFAWLVEHFPKQPAFRKTCANALLSLGRNNEALAELQTALKLAPHDKDTRDTLARLKGR